MKIKEFLENVKGKTTEEIEAMIVVRKYIPIQEKRMVARDVLDRCVDDVDGFIAIDEIDRDMFFQIERVKAYTCLEFSENYDDMMNEFDAFCADRWFYILSELIGRDSHEFSRVMTYEKELLLKSNSIEAQIAKVTNSLIGAIDGLSNKIGNSIGEFDMTKILPEGTNMNELLEVLKKFK